MPAVRLDVMIVAAKKRLHFDKKLLVFTTYIEIVAYVPLIPSGDRLKVSLYDEKNPITTEVQKCGHWRDLCSDYGSYLRQNHKWIVKTISQVDQTN